MGVRNKVLIEKKNQGYPLSNWKRGNHSFFKSSKPFETWEKKIWKVQKICQCSILFRNSIKLIIKIVFIILRINVVADHWRFLWDSLINSVIFSSSGLSPSNFAHIIFVSRNVGWYSIARNYSKTCRLLPYFVDLILFFRD